MLTRAEVHMRNLDPGSKINEGPARLVIARCGACRRSGLEARRPEPRASHANMIAHPLAVNLRAMPRPCRTPVRKVAKASGDSRGVM